MKRCRWKIVFSVTKVCYSIFVKNIRLRFMARMHRAIEKKEGKWRIAHNILAACDTFFVGHEVKALYSNSVYEKEREGVWENACKSECIPILYLI